MAAGEPEVERNRRVQPRRTVTAGFPDIGPGEQEALAPAELLHDHDLQVSENPIVEIDDHPLVHQISHGAPFRIGLRPSAIDVASKHIAQLYA
ncbi:hypothetical protein [Cryobacterium sp. 10C3]|uniref:hypothetical protein n=1 Tax=Cryobacterium sp. 10C3 TaxID=3048577 RepID=UPI002AB3A4F6|nr:hypothetical protein [Cryobacterium sp. 10C3]MDY7558431.1 hypothetical protein [Cryobacterium sp. 10C3]